MPRDVRYCPRCVVSVPDRARRECVEQSECIRLSASSPICGITTASTPLRRRRSASTTTTCSASTVRDGDPWIARVFPPARPRAGVEGDAAILRFLERQDYPAERLAIDDAVSAFDGSSVLVTRFVTGRLLPSPAVGPEGTEKFAIMGDLLGRLHALPFDESVSRPGGASGEDPSREGSPRQDLLAALAFLDAVDTKVAAATRERFDQLRDQVRSADDGQGLPEALLHGNLLHAPDHVIVSEQGPVAIQWKAAGRGPRLADFAYLMWGTWLNADWIDAAVGAYRQHVELTDDELDRLEAVMYVRPLYLACFDWRRSLANGHQPSSSDGWWDQPDPTYISAAAAATRAAYRRKPAACLTGTPFS